ncbi:MAG: Spy/CpxP family protein refolding chaperone [Proteobacteria bacterium]|nr:Spy/CpxP family protein refolding chaperone [Pseudomonadota bacterium]
MERRRWLATLAGVGAAIILGGVAYAATLAAEPPAPAAGRPPGLLLSGLMPHALLGHLADELALTPEQRQTIHGFFEQARPDFERLHAELRANSEKLLATAPDDPAYQTVVASTSQAAADLASQFVLEASQLRAQVHSVLTPGQRAKLVTLQARLQAQAAARGSHGHGPWGSPPVAPNP